MKHYKVPVPARILQGLEAVRISGETNMFDIPVVAVLASKMGYPEAAEWVREHKCLYAGGVLNGFTSTTGDRSSSSDIAEDDRLERGDGQCADS